MSKLIRERENNFEKLLLRIFKKEIIRTYRIGDKVIVFKPILWDKFASRWTPGYTINNSLKPGAGIIQKETNKLTLYLYKHI